ncbi:MAG: hypothetical protein HKN39_00465 [Flavobacteriales bacterium]|nr:hypothetical protein [Flavobacteriales bacterium]
MKFNWGTGITIAIIAFMAFILFMVFKATSTNADLEAPDYYDQEIKYQTRIDAKDNADALDGELKVEQTSNAIIFTFPNDISDRIDLGTIHFFRPDNASHDRVFEIDVKNGMQAIPSNELYGGRYSVKIEWKANDKDFYVERTLNIDNE